MNRFIVAYAVTILVSVAASLSASSQNLEIPETPIFSRSDCMVRIDFKEPAEKGEEYPALGTFLDHIMLYGAKHLMPLGFTSGTPGNGIFLIYNFRCDQKFEFTEEMIGAFVTQNPGYFEEVSVSRDRISPNFENSISCGDWWTDGWAGCR